MRKKNTAQDIEDMKQIIREFPGGTVARKVSASGKLYGYDFTDEQLDWLEANYVKRFKCLLISEALGINDTSLRRAMDSRFASLTFERKKIRNEREQKKHKRSNVTLEKELEKRRKLAELEERMEDIKRQECIAAFNESMAKEHMELQKREQKELQKQKKLDEEDAAYTAECLKRFPEDRKRKPIPFTHAQEAVRKKMWNRDYLLPDDEELLTDNRTNVYWDEETNRSPKLENDAIAAGLSVIRYEDMFPDMGNEMSSCKGADCNGRQFYQMSR